MYKKIYSRPNVANANTLVLTDYGPQPFVIDINQATKQNTNFRTALWTGEFLQLTLMSIPVGGGHRSGNAPRCGSIFADRTGKGACDDG